MGLKWAVVDILGPKLIPLLQIRLRLAGKDKKFSLRGVSVGSRQVETGKKIVYRVNLAARSNMGSHGNGSTPLFIFTISLLLLHHFVFSFLDFHSHNAVISFLYPQIRFFLTNAPRYL